MIYSKVITKFQKNSKHNLSTGDQPQLDLPLAGPPHPDHLESPQGHLGKLARFVGVALLWISVLGMGWHGMR